MNEQRLVIPFRCGEMSALYISSNRPYADNTKKRHEVIEITIVTKQDRNAFSVTCGTNSHMRRPFTQVSIKTRRNIGGEIDE